MAYQDQHSKKRLIVCCDGTWQASDRGEGTTPTNIARLSRMIARVADNGTPQIVYYQSGVGTSGQNYRSFDKLSVSNAIADIVTAATNGVAHACQGTFGWGLKENIAAAYNFLSTNYKFDHHDRGSDDHANDDEIFLFGFSRGAYTARSLAGLITELGLLKPEYMEHFPRAYRLYREHGNHAAERGEKRNIAVPFLESAMESASPEDRAFLGMLRKDKTMMHQVNVKAVGVWDTVGALGIPESWLTKQFSVFNSQYKFHDTALNSRIENAFQALALDEHRGAFKPTLWYLDPKFLKDDPTYTGPRPNFHEPLPTPLDPRGHRSRPAFAGKIVPNLKQCWFPGYHESCGGGNTTASLLLPQETNMPDITLAWMCDQLDGLLTFSPPACQHLLLRPHHPSIATYAAGWNLDLAALMPPLALPLAGGTAPRTPGMYKKDLTQAVAAGPRDFVTNETVHPSVAHRIDAFTNGNLLNPLIRYAPRAFAARPWAAAPAWHWVPGKGRGAAWVRPEVPGWSGSFVWGKRERERRVELDEWVIRALEGRVNFEARLLPERLRERLWVRNGAVVRLGREEEGRGVYWTRGNEGGMRVLGEREERAMVAGLGAEWGVLPAGEVEETRAYGALPRGYEGLPPLREGTGYDVQPVVGGYEGLPREVPKYDVLQEGAALLDGGAAVVGQVPATTAATMATKKKKGKGGKAEVVGDKAEADDRWIEQMGNGAVQPVGT